MHTSIASQAPSIQTNSCIMPPAEHHMPDVDLPKHSLFSTGNHNSHMKTQRHELFVSRTKNNRQHSHADHGPKRLKKRGNPKIDSLIAAVCQWTVEHQVGGSFLKYFLISTHLAYNWLRSFSEPPAPACASTYFLPSGATEHP